MSIRVRTWSIVPYGGMWRFTHPETGARISGRTKHDIMRFARHYQSQHNLPIGLDFDEQVEQWICREMPDECVDSSAVKRARVWLGMADIVRGSRNFLPYVAAGSPKVSAEEADRRSRICLACPEHTTFALPCGGLCGELLAMAAHLPATAVNLDQHACGVCHCSLRAAVWMPLEHQCAGLNSEHHERFKAVKESHNCWKQCV